MQIPPKENTLRRSQWGMRTVGGRHSGDIRPPQGGLGAEGASAESSASISQAKGQSGISHFTLAECPFL